MIIFGWGYQTIKDIGVVFNQVCNHCNNEKHWILRRTITWFTLFFIPVIPYSIKYFLSCSICEHGFYLSQKQVSEIKPLIEINQLLIDEKITIEEYGLKLRQLNGDTALQPVEVEAIETKVSPEDKTTYKYCSDCGTTVAENSKFCDNCGVRVNNI